jgi:hypothetical protein
MEPNSNIHHLIENAKKNMKPDILITYFLENIRINDKNISFDKSADDMKTFILNLSDNCEIFNMKYLENYILRAYNFPDEYKFSYTHLDAMKNTSFYLVYFIFNYISRMRKGCQYNYYNHNDVRFIYTNLNISEENVLKLKSGDMNEIINLILILLSCNHCSFREEKEIVDTQNIEININS